MERFMGKAKNFMRHIFPRGLPVLMFLVLTIAAWLISVLAGRIFSGISVGSYESTNVPAAAMSQSSGLQVAPTYRCYLDISPSMLGYASSEGRMAAVGQALLTLTRERGGSAAYYTCGDEVNNVTETVFFNYFENEDAMAETYRQALMQDTLETTIQGIDLCRIFTDQYSDGQVFDAGDGMVNVIITDLNFLKDWDDLDGHNALLDRFTQYLSAYMKDCNFSIYRIRSSHIGSPTDEYNPNKTQTANREDSFFIIVLVRNDGLYRQYTGNFENVFGRQEIPLTEKHTLSNDPVGENHAITLNRGSEFFQSNTQRTGLHWDNQSFRKLPDNAVGFRVAYTGDEPWVSLQLPVTGLSLPGYDGATEDATSSAKISTHVRAYQNTLFGGWAEDSQFSGLVGCTAYMRNYDGSWYLCLNMDLEKDLPSLDRFGDSFKFYRCLLLDVRFQLETPYYPVPAWVESIDTDTLPASGNSAEKIGIGGFIQTLNTAKAGAYDEQADSYRGYLGNLLVFVNY